MEIDISIQKKIDISILDLKIDISILELKIDISILEIDILIQELEIDTLIQDHGVDTETEVQTNSINSVKISKLTLAWTQYAAYA